MIRCIVVDDEQHALDVLTHFIEQIPYLELVKTLSNPMEAIQLLNETTIDLIFLDVQMPGISGLDLVRAIQGKAKVILTTAYSGFAAEGYDLDVIDYLIKPIPLVRFLKAVQKALPLISPAATATPPMDDYIFVKTEVKGKVLKINLIDIDYIEGMKNYIAIHHGGQRTMTLLNMKDLEERLPKQHFIRVHKSFIVAIGKIACIEGNAIMLKNIKADILLGDTYKAAFQEIMKHKLI